jgi:large-conductance mechanosensitive channel
MEQFLQQFTDYGAPYFLLAVAIWFIVRLSNKLEESQEKRITEAKETTKVIDANTTALNTLSELVKRKQ